MRKATKPPTLQSITPYQMRKLKKRWQREKSLIVLMHGPRDLVQEFLELLPSTASMDPRTQFMTHCVLIEAGHLKAAVEAARAFVKPGFGPVLIAMPGLRLNRGVAHEAGAEVEVEIGRVGGE